MPGFYTFEKITRFYNFPSTFKIQFFGIDATESQEAQRDLAQNLVERDRGKELMEWERIARNQELQS